MLSKASLQDALNELGFMQEIDLFASRINNQFTKYVSYKPDPSALAIDAFTLDWSKLMFYAFPPFSVILEQDSCRRSHGCLHSPRLAHAGLVSKSNTNVSEGKSRLKSKEGSSQSSKPPQGGSPTVEQAHPNGVPLIRDSLDNFSIR